VTTCRTCWALQNIDARSSIPQRKPVWLCAVCLLWPSVAHYVDATYAACLCRPFSCSTKFLIASSRWNRDAGQDVVLVRLSAVTDWEEGGRTSSQAATRIFNKEAAEGPRQVLVARREVRAGGARRRRLCRLLLEPGHRWTPVLADSTQAACQGTTLSARAVQACWLPETNPCTAAALL
jgi:hypothetical protein